MSTEAAAEARLRRRARAAGHVIRKSRREIGHNCRGGFHRFVVIDSRNVIVDAGDEPEDLIRRYVANVDDTDA